MAKLRDLVELIAAAIMAALVVVVLFQVIARYVLRIPLSWSEEVARYLLVWGTLLGAAAATARSQHIVIDTFSSALKGRRRRILASSMRRQARPDRRLSPSPAAAAHACSITYS